MIPRERLSIRFSRSGGPGGQNVNKVETKVEVRFVLAEADWIPEPVRNRLRELQPGMINKEGELVLSSSRFRSQSMNLQDCIAKLEALIAAAGQRRKRRIPTGPTRSSRARHSAHKRRRSEKKAHRHYRSSSGSGDE